MDHLSRLPVECLEKILRYIVGAPPSTSRPALSALCRVNRYISGVATSFLYYDPFDLLTGNAVYVDRGRRLRCLLTTLLINIPTSQIHHALLLGLVARIEPETNTNTDTATFSYISANHLRHIRYFNLPTSAFLEYGGGGLENKNYTPEELGYISGQDLLEMYLLDRKDTTCRSKNPSSQLQEYYSNVLYREATWSLAGPILEQLESLSFPLSDIGRYLMLVGRLVRLAHVHVHLDMVFYCDCCDGSDMPQEPRRLREKGAFNDLVQFVKAHIEFFPGRLETVTTSDAGFWEVGTQSCPYEVEHEIYKMLPSQYQPTSICKYNWRKVAAHLETIDLSKVWEVNWLPPREVVDHEWLLRRCRELKWLTVQALPARGCFDWAVQEKMDLERLGQGHASTNTTTVVGPVPVRRPLGRQQQEILSESTPPLPAHVHHGLVKLGRITLEECRMPSRDLDAAVFAFSQSLYMLCIETLLGPEDTQTIHIGREWCTVPGLTGLDLRAHAHRLVLDPLIFTRFPRLKNTTIKDDTFEYSCEDVVPCELAQGSALSVVYLRGWSALVFNPSALEWSKELIVLKLSMAKQDGYCFIPPVNELNASYGLGSNATTTSITRPRWTWDWDFPRLVDINLTSEFTYMFEFRMLHGCPRLDTLRLHMRTVDGNHTRTISETDLFVSRTGGSQERIVAPKLRKVYMNGHWVFSSASVLSQFLGQMFPAVERLTARGWGNVSVGSLVEVLRTTAGHVRMAPRPTYDYLSHVRHLNPPAFDCWEPLIFQPDKEPTTEELAYLQGEEYEGVLLPHLHSIIVYREVIWSLASPILDQLESLTIPLSEIDRYLQVVNRLGRLECIDLSIDEVYETGDLGLDESTEQCKDKAMRALMQFVEDHVRLSPGRLRTVNICDSSIWPRGYKTNFKDIESQIYRHLPPMPPPTVLNRDNWARLMCHPLTTNLRYVETIVADHGQWRDPVFEYSQLLRRCRNLTTLEMRPLSKGSFKWAVQEKAMHAECGSLVPLQRVHIREYHSFTDEINDIAFAFSNTLQVIRVDDVAQGGGGPIRIGQGWVDMPKLTYLTLNIRKSRLVIDPLLLEHCPNLTSLNLTEYTMGYLCADIVSAFPVQLGQLFKLTLVGWPALTFHPASLHAMSKLGLLRICSSEFYKHDCFIPPVEELEQSFCVLEDFCSSATGTGTVGDQRGAVRPGVGRRPLWTWDWILPQLTVAEFKGEFAYRFEFRMLRGCPSLVRLALMIATVQDTHSRVLTRDDFFVTDPITTNIKSTSRQQQQQPTPKPKRIIAPALKELFMTGPWVLDDTLVPLLFDGMFPELRVVTMPECSGFSHRALVKSLKGNPQRMETMELGLPEPSLEEQKELGLYRRIGRMEDYIATFSFSVHFRGTEYIVLRDPSPTASPASTAVSDYD
ncbi:hypothetical protein EC957_003377 [Mortierella hygrophila]|uniref:Uncharacterized protein n=1 Tax=Mortierella hygrophila TaxID=979708 RepID=A0A9P6F2Y1_9FUNG|nr:hypothetical protein EC957_003377 [Mortierella hygrophila]